MGCGQTSSSIKGTPYYRLQHRRTTFDTVVTLLVDGVSLSAIARIERLAWNTVARWLARAASVCRRFSDERTTGFVATELQADEIRSFTGGKTRPTWVFAAIEVGSHLWTSTVVGRRSYRNTLALVRDVAARMTFVTGPLIVTDGFEFYGKVIRRVFGPAALYAQVIKTRRHDRAGRPTGGDRRHVAIGRGAHALGGFVDGEHVVHRTVESDHPARFRLPVTTDALACARDRRARRALQLLRCYYNFVRPHGALKFGRETRTPAMQASLATRRLTLRDIFVSLRRVARWLSDVRVFADSHRRAAAAVTYMPVAA